MEAARRLGVSRRRVQALIEADALPAERIGSQWIVPASALRFYQHNKPVRRGRPLKAGSAWNALRDAGHGPRPVSRQMLDELRRQVHPRAKHLNLYVHPGLLDEIASQPDVVVSGRLAAAEDLPVNSLDNLDIYVRAGDYGDLVADVKARPVASGENLRLHVVEDEAWPFADGQHFADPWVVWLDLEDQGDRAAELVLDNLLGGRLVAA